MELGQYRDLFLKESNKQLDGLKQLFSDIEKNPQASDEIKEAMRLAHTLKGMAGMMSFEKLTKLSQAMEDTLNGFCTSNKPIEKEPLGVFSKGYDTLTALIKDVEEEKDSNIDVEGIIEEIKAINTSA
ncbi:MAG: Hpt domain-containing protein [bacterium]